MDEQIKQRWVAALRSGEYQQTDSELRNDKGYCCLGVLCDILKDEVNGEWGDSDSFISCGREVNFCSLPTAVAKKANITNHARLVNSPYQYVTLVELNDDGIPFSEIADIIENYELVPYE